MAEIHEEVIRTFGSEALHSAIRRLSEEDAGQLAAMLVGLATGQTQKPQSKAEQQQQRLEGLMMEREKMFREAMQATQARRQQVHGLMTDYVKKMMGDACPK